ncbi:MAG: hypothetical protein Q9207_007174 [Kuettlingeria erythrocarpa]
MDRQDRERWHRLLDQARHDLEEEEQRSGALTTTGLEQLMNNLSRSATLYSRQDISRLADKIQRSLKHIQTFTSAISSAAQYKPIACLVWGGIQAVLQCTCIVPNVLEEIFDLVAELNNDLPLIEVDLALYSSREELQWPLQDMYQDYLNYCITVVRYLRNIVSYLWKSSPQQALRQTKELFRTHKNFEKQVDSIHRQEVHSHNLSHIEDINSKRSSPKSTQTNSRKFVSTISMFRNFAFAGRDNELFLIHDKLLPGEAPGGPHPSSTSVSPVCFVLHGLGGTGKTQTALEYTCRYQHDYDAMFWLSAEREPELAAGFALIALNLGLVNDDGNSEDEAKQNQSKAIMEARNWLQDTDKQWLLVFDNVKEIRDLEAYLPTETKIRGSVCLEREAADEAEADLARETSAIVGGLPLAIATIGGYIKESESFIVEFLQIMKRSSNAWEDTQHIKMQHYEKTSGIVFDIALKELSKYPKDRKLVDILAFLNPDSIPEGILIAPHNSEEVDFLSSKADVLEMIRVLRRRQLIKRETSGSEEACLSIHRSLQRSITVDLTRACDHRWRVYNQAFLLLRRGMPMSSPIQDPEPEKWPQFQRYTPQILSLRTHCLWPEPPVEFPVDFAHILSDMGTYMWHAGLVDNGSEALQTAENILDDRGVEEINPLRSDILANLGAASRFSGASQRKESMNRRVEALKIRREVSRRYSEEEADPQQ